MELPRPGSSECSLSDPDGEPVGTPLLLHTLLQRPKADNPSFVKRFRRVFVLFDNFVAITFTPG